MRIWSAVVGGEEYGQHCHLKEVEVTYTIRAHCEKCVVAVFGGRWVPELCVGAVVARSHGHSAKVIGLVCRLALSAEVDVLRPHLLYATLFHVDLRKLCVAVAVLTPLQCNAVALLIVV